MYTRHGASAAGQLPAATGAASQTIHTAFREYFELVLADTDALRDAAMRLRYAVYCEELGYEATRAFPDGRERDGFEARSLHCLLRHRASGQFAGCIRLVLHAEDEPFPFEHVCAGSLDGVSFSPGDRRRFGEISRLAVHSGFRRRSEQGVPYPKSDAGLGTEPERRVYPHIALGLYLGAAAVGLGHPLDGVFALMERRLCARLRRLGIRFRQVGAAVQHRGERIPYFIDRGDFLDGLHHEFLPLLGALRTELSEEWTQRRA